MKVLIADDSPLLRRNIGKLIRSLGTVDRTEESYDVPTTIEMLKTFRPDILFLDIRMPGGTGFDVLEYIRSDESEVNPKVIVFTNYADAHNRKKSIAMGAHYCFDKTNEFESAINVLRDVEAI